MKQATLEERSFADVTAAMLGASAGTVPWSGITLLHTLTDTALAADVYSIDTTLIAVPEKLHG